METNLEGFSIAYCCNCWSWLHSVVSLWDNIALLQWHKFRSKRIEFPVALKEHAHLTQIREASCSLRARGFAVLECRDEDPIALSRGSRDSSCSDIHSTRSRQAIVTAALGIIASSNRSSIFCRHRGRIRTVFVQHHRRH